MILELRFIGVWEKGVWHARVLYPIPVEDLGGRKRPDADACVCS